MIVLHCFERNDVAVEHGDPLRRFRQLLHHKPGCREPQSLVACCLVGV